MSYNPTVVLFSVQLCCPLMPYNRELMVVLVLVSYDMQLCCPLMSCNCAVVLSFDVL